MPHLAAKAFEAGIGRHARVPGHAVGADKTFIAPRLTRAEGDAPAVFGVQADRLSTLDLDAKAGCRREGRRRLRSRGI